jgi:transposase
MRIQAVKALESGATPKSVAQAYGVNMRSVFRWLAAFVEGGQRALQAKPIPGRPPKLDGEQISWLAGVVRNQTPQQYPPAVSGSGVASVSDPLRSGH